MHRQLGQDTQIKIPIENIRGICQHPLQLCVCPMRSWSPTAISCTSSFKASHTGRSVSALHFLVASASASGFCKVFPVDLADGLCWNISKIRPEHHDLLAFAWTGFCFCLVFKKKKKKTFSPPPPSKTRGMGAGRKEDRDEGKNTDSEKY